MSASRYIINQCLNINCQFRFPDREDDFHQIICPKCGSNTRIVEPEHPTQRVKILDRPVDGPQVEALLDNIRSSLNVGSILRTADGAGLSRIHLCGISATPDNPKVAKTALGAEFAIPWMYHLDGLSVINTFIEKGYRIWALEGGPKSQSIFSLPYELHGPPIVLVVGNEVSGIDPGILNHCDRIVAIPMEGFKRSLNVAVAFGIAAYFLRFGITISNHGENIKS